MRLVAAEEIAAWATIEERFTLARSLSFSDIDH